MKLPALSGAGTGIWQCITEPAVWASAGRMVTTVEAAAAPSASTVRRLGTRLPPSFAGSSFALLISPPYACRLAQG
jgi:hypothetical protein